MADSNSILVAFHLLSNQGGQVQSVDGTNFFNTLRSHLQKKGVENKDSNDVLLLFDFNHPITALNAVFETIEKVKKEFSWQPASGALPIQIILHLKKERDLLASLRAGTSSLWDLLQPELLYISRALKLQWEQLMAGQKLPSHSFGDEEKGFFPVKFSDQAVFRTDILFPHCDLPKKGPMTECFYCGMTYHVPAECPSKFLTMEMKGMSEVGYMPLDRLKDLYKEVFGNLEKMVNILKAGVRGAQIRKDLALQVFIAYFDLFGVYQPRFLRNIAFNPHYSWEDIVSKDKVVIDSQNLHLGLDCLRVGQYAQAEELFVDESRRPGGKQFYATVGRAFIALEMNRENDMVHYLESASNMASTDKDRIYISLLLSRCYAMHDNPWKAEQALDNIFSVDRACLDGLYRHVQILAASGSGEKALQQLRSLVTEDRRFFMTSLMDSMLQPIHGPVEDLLSSLQQVQMADAEENLLLAQQQVEELRSWLEEDDEQLVEMADDLTNLVKQRERASYYDTMDVALKGKGLVFASFRIQEAKLDELAREIDNTAGRWEVYKNFWKNYTYQPLFKNFYAALLKIKDKLGEVRTLTEKNQGGQVYRKSVGILDSAAEELDKLRPMVARMHWIKIGLDGIRIFGLRLVITELVLIGLMIVLFPVLTVYLTEGLGAGFVELMHDPVFQKQAVFVVTLFVAPVAALAQTLWKIMEM